MLLPQPEHDQCLSSDGRYVLLAVDLVRRPFHWPEYKTPYIYPAFEPSKPEIVRNCPASFHLDQFEPQPVGIRNHDRTCVAEPVRPPCDRNLHGLQVSHDDIQIRERQGHVIDHLPA